MEKQGNYYQPQKAINWPKEFLPGFTDNFGSNETYYKGLKAEEIWQFLEDISIWCKYYNAASDVKVIDQNNQKLKLGTKFTFKTFGYKMNCEVIEYQAPMGQMEGRIAWRASTDDKNSFECIHAWLIENMPDGRVRILTQESQKGTLAIDMAKTNDLNNTHQNWIDSLVEHSKKNSGGLLSQLI